MDNHNENAQKQVLIYQADDGSFQTEVQLQGETVWLNQKQDYAGYIALPIHVTSQEFNLIFYTFINTPMKKNANSIKSDYQNNQT